MYSVFFHICHFSIIFVCDEAKEGTHSYTLLPFLSLFHCTCNNTADDLFLKDDIQNENRENT